MNPQTPEIRIREFHPGDEAAFRRLNEEWIARYFKIEPKDRYSFADPQRTILDPGGKILFATVNDECVGCCALVPMEPDEFEVAKMAVTPSHQGSGIGRMVLCATIEAARSLGARRLYLETNHTLTPAIHLYESLGFKHLDPASTTPSPYARADVFMELIFAEGAPSLRSN